MRLRTQNWRQLTALVAALGSAHAACGKVAQRPQPASTSAVPVTSHATPATPAASAAPSSEKIPDEPDDGLVAIDGAELLARVRASGQKGALVNIWASWCGPCKDELPMLIKLAPALKSEGIALLLVSADQSSGRSAAATALRELAAPAPSYIIHGPLGPFKRAFGSVWKGAVPSSFLFDAGASVRYAWPGPVLEHELTPIIEAFLSGQPLEGPERVERRLAPE